MSDPRPAVLVVDDELLNLELLAQFLATGGYRSVTASGGQQAWEILERAPRDFHAVLLDRIMPKMNGLQLLAKMKANPALQMLPVILLTGATGSADVLEGLQAGAYYYLTKPFDKEVLLSIVRTAVNDQNAHRALEEQLQMTVRTLTMMDAAQFRFRTLQEAKILAAVIANACPDPQKAGVGLVELMINAVEHGNLGITYTEKSRLMRTQDWEAEIERRLRLPQCVDRYATVEFERRPNEIHVIIKDAGPGFDWQPYLEMSPERAFHTHGRGIARAKILSFDRLEYRGSGSVVEAVIFIPAQLADMPSPAVNVMAELTTVAMSVMALLTSVTGGL